MVGVAGGGGAPKRQVNCNIAHTHRHINTHTHTHTHTHTQIHTHTHTPDGGGGGGGRDSCLAMGSLTGAIAGLEDFCWEGGGGMGATGNTGGVGGAGGAAVGTQRGNKATLNIGYKDTGLGCPYMVEVEVEEVPWM